MDAAQAAELLVTGFLPLGNQACDVANQQRGEEDPLQWYSLCIRVSFLQKPVIELSTDSLTLVVQLINIPRAGMGYSHNWPQ